MKKILIFIFLSIAMSLIFGIASSQAKGKISGRVTDASGNGMANVDVKAYDHDDNWIASSSTDSNGNYTLRVPKGIYRVHFNPLPSSGYYAPEWYEDKSNMDLANFLTVTASKTTSNINAQLEIGGKISGRVTDVSGNGIANVDVFVFETNSSYWIYGPGTDSNGNYNFNLPIGTYKVYFRPLSSSGYYALKWYDDKRNQQIADLVTITAAQTTSNINAQLEIGGKISGQVAGPSRNGIANVYVDALDTNGNWMNGSSTDNRGNYSFNMPAGTYKVEFIPLPSTSRRRYYAPELYDNRSNFQEADLVTVTANQTTFNINAHLEIGGAISGQVTDTSGNGIANVYVTACDPNDNNIVINGTRTDSDGSYNILLAAGDYKIGFFPHPGLGNYPSEWYNDKSDFESADIVTVSKRNTKSNINAQLGSN